MSINEFLESITLENEEWRPVKNYESFYMISNLGRLCSCGGYRKNIKGVSRLYNPVLIARNIGDTGYEKTTLYINGEKVYVTIHRLVAEAFIPNPENKPFVDHIDGNRANNNVSNLRWVTPEENANNDLTKTSAYIRKKKTNIFDRPIVSISLTDGSIKEYNSISEA